jgi:hypothetical protein
MNAAEYVETLPNGVSHRILQFGDNGPFDIGMLAVLGSLFLL